MLTDFNVDIFQDTNLVLNYTLFQSYIGVSEYIDVDIVDQCENCVYEKCIKCDSKGFLKSLLHFYNKI